MDAPDGMAIAGKCMCEAVSFQASTKKSDIDACHCEQCRRWSGHYWASVNTEYSSLKFVSGEEDVAWHQSSELVRRGFCRKCGSALFWHPFRHPDYANLLAIGAGSLDRPSGIRLAVHVFVSEKGDYYGIDDGLPQKPRH